MHYLLLLPFALWAIVIIVSLDVSFSASAVTSKAVNDCVRGTLQVLSSTSYMAMQGNRGRVTGCLKCRYVRCACAIPLLCSEPSRTLLALAGPSMWLRPASGLQPCACSWRLMHRLLPQRKQRELTLMHERHVAKLICTV